MGGLGAVRERVVSGSDRYGDSCLSAPVSTPLLPVFRSFGIPTPAKMPASWDAPPEAAPPELSPVSLLLLALLPPGTGGASPPGGLGAIPGTGGAPIGGPEGPSSTFPTCGAERSLTWVTFFSFAPDRMSPSSAPCLRHQQQLVSQGVPTACLYALCLSQRQLQAARVSRREEEAEEEEDRRQRQAAEGEVVEAARALRRCRVCKIKPGGSRILSYVDTARRSERGRLEARRSEGEGW